MGGLGPPRARDLRRGEPVTTNRAGTPRVALVHDWLTGMRGGEKVLEVLCERFPHAELFTLLHIPGSVSPVIASPSSRFGRSMEGRSSRQHTGEMRVPYARFKRCIPIGTAAADEATSRPAFSAGCFKGAFEVRRTRLRCKPLGFDQFVQRIKQLFLSPSHRVSAAVAEGVATFHRSCTRLLQQSLRRSRCWSSRDALRVQRADSGNTTSGISQGRSVASEQASFC